MSESSSPIIGIDLGTTNSVVAAVVNGKVQVLKTDGEAIVPSCVGMSVDGKLLVGAPAKNQLAVFPERTISSVKRRMGQNVKLKMADAEYSPQEISAIILRHLRHQAEEILKTEVTRAVITVPAFFDESQRQATREAGELAGLTVERIINEPTAASLVYHPANEGRRHLIVYDLGGGTFDVSIVRLESGVVEVLSSKGDTQLGGDDFDELLTKYVADAFLNEYGFDLMAQPTTRWRLLQACERAKCELSFSSSVRIAEEFIATVNGQPANLDLEITRREYEDLITAQVERTIGCVDEAIRDSGLAISQIDELILVGGSTRTPLVQQRLREEFRRDPLWAVNPDLAVALGAATQAAMQNGQAIGPVLIDVSTHTLGLEVLDSNTAFSETTFCPIIRRNSPLPAKYEDIFRTAAIGQSEVEIHVLQGESSQISRNRTIGRFTLDGLNTTGDADGKIVILFELTLDGTLKVSAVEKKSGLTKSHKITNALSTTTEQESNESKEKILSMFADYRGIGSFDEEDMDDESKVDMDDQESSTSPSIGQRVDPAETPQSALGQLLSKARSMRSSMSNEDGEDVDRLMGLIQTATEKDDRELLSGLEQELEDLLFYIS